MVRTIYLLLFLVSTAMTNAQTNISCSSLEIENVLIGNYDSSTFSNNLLASGKSEIISAILQNANSDSLKQSILELNNFKTRHSASDTVSDLSGMGAARRWGFNKFQNLNAQKPHNLLVGYLDFDVDMCGVMAHRNVIAVIPGSSPSVNECILIEAHLDSRCESRCDTSCVARGIEDNASGSALVIELARVMSQMELDRTIVFMLTTGEEQGLHGGRAFAKYAKSKGIQIRAVQNNDVIGGVICGKTASPPGCPAENDVDSTQVRIFSAGAYNSAHKQYARYTKLQYEEELKNKVAVPMQISIMSAEDRTGRGGDHIPFREEGFTAIRFTSANEHGNGHIDSEYGDRQHTTGDVLGEDTDNDGKIDKYFIDFNYLSRNTQINAVAASMAAIGPSTPTLTLTRKYGTILQVRIIDQKDYMNYRVALHTQGHDWDTVLTLNGTKEIDITVEPDKFYFVSVANVDEQGVESLFSKELSVRTNAVEIKKKEKVVLLTNRPNPFDFATTLAFYLEDIHSDDVVSMRITNSKGQLVKELSINAKNGLNEVLYEHGYGRSGYYVYSLVLNGNVLASRRMIFDN
jgi:hypothetical protein